MLDQAVKSVEVLREVLALQKAQMNQIELLVNSLDCMVTNMLHAASVLPSDEGEDMQAPRLELLHAQPINHISS